MKTQIDNKIIVLGFTVVVLTFFALQSLFSGGNFQVKEKLGFGQQDSVEVGVDIFKPFENVDIEAKAVYVFDMVNNEVIFGQNADSQLPLASITKLMTALVAKESLYDWQTVSIPLEAIRQEGDSGLLVGEKWNSVDLLRAMLIASSNDAAFAVASVVSVSDFVQYMNKKSCNLGLSQTFFLNPTGLDEFTNLAGAYGSARDVAHLIEYSASKYPAVFDSTGYEAIYFNSHKFKNTNRLIGKIPGIIFGKTGYSDLAGGNLVVIIDVGLGYPVSIVVLGSSEAGRFSDVEVLYRETIKWLQSKDD